MILVLFGIAWILAALGLPPIEDETYYWTWSRALALTYFDHPPGIAWVMRASTMIFGDNVIGLRAPSAIATATVLVATTKTARILEPQARTVLLLLGAPMFAVGYVPGTHDVLLGAAMALAAYAIAKDPRGPVGPFILVASLLIKHAAAVIALGVLIGALLTQEGRGILRDEKRPWIGAALGMMVVAPWIWADGSIAFQADHVFAYAPARGPLAIPLVIGSMLLTLGPIGGALIWPATIAAIKARAGAVESALAGGALLLLFGCVIATWAGSGEANWPMPALALAAPLVAAWIARRPRAARIANPIAQASAAIALVLMIHAARPLFFHQRDPTLRGAGFAEIARVAEAHPASIIVTRRYQAASLLRYHGQDRREILELGTKRRKSQYDLWPRPIVCPGDDYLWIGPERGPPIELGGTSIADPIAIPRRRTPDGPIIETWWAHRIRAARGFGCAP